MKKLLTILLSVFMIATSLTMNVFADEHNHTGWINWGDEESEWTSLPTEVGNYYLTHDVILSTTWTVKGDNQEVKTTNLCLNGYVIKANATDQNKFSVITIPTNAELNLYDCKPNAEHSDDSLPKGGVITGGNADLGGGVYSNANKGQSPDFFSYFNMYGGTIYNNISHDKGGGIYLNDGAIFVMNGGSIINNKASNKGGGIYNSISDVTINAGNISNNEVCHFDDWYEKFYGKGGAIYSDGPTKINGGELTNNYAGEAGGAVYSCNELTIGGSPSIKNNKSGGDADKVGAISNNITLVKDKKVSIDISHSLTSTNIGLNVVDENDEIIDGRDFIIVSDSDCSNNFISENSSYVIWEQEGKTVFAPKPSFNLCNGKTLRETSIPDSVEPYNDFELVGWYDKRTGGTKIENVSNADYGKIYYAHWKDKTTGRLVLSEQLNVIDGILYIGLGDGTEPTSQENELNGKYRRLVSSYGSDFAQTYGISYDNSSTTLTLDKANIMPFFPYSGFEPAAILTNQDLTIKLVGTNRLGNPVSVDINEIQNSDYSEYGTYVGTKALDEDNNDYNLTFIGDDNSQLIIHDQQTGILANDVTFNEDFKGKIEIKDLGVSYACAIDSSNTVKILGGKLDLTSYKSHGISANNVHIGKRAQVKILARNHGMSGNSNIVFDDNADINIVSLSEGIYLGDDTTITIKDSVNLKIDSQETPIYANEYSNGKVKLEGGAISLKVPYNKAINTGENNLIFDEKHIIIKNGIFEKNPAHDWYQASDTITPLDYAKPVIISFGTSSGKITTGALNSNTEVKDAGLKTITEDEAKTIVNTDPNLSNLKQAINNGKNIIIYTEVENPSDESKTAFTSRNIDESNAVILDINLYG